MRVRRFCWMGFGLLLFVPSFVFGQASDFRVKPLAVWEEFGAGGSLREPQSISVGPEGYVYVADTGNNRILKLDVSGGFIGEIGGFGWDKEQFDTPMALSARSGLDVFVADHFNGRIERFDKDLNYLAMFTSSEEWAEHLQFGFPLSVDISSQGELFCLDGENHRVLKLDVQGAPQISFGDFDAGEGRLIKPQRLEISDGRVYVSDGDGRILVFDVLGNYLSTFGEGVLERPVGMTANQGMVLVADPAQNAVFVFRDGGVIGRIDAASGVPLNQPVDAAWWRDRIYILDQHGGAIHVLEWLGGGMKPPQ